MKSSWLGSLVDRYTTWYDDSMPPTFNELEKTALLRHLPDSNQFPSLLDVGCGDGTWMSTFAEKGFIVTGVDPSGKKIESARKKGIPGAAFRQGWGEELKFPDASFDVVTAIGSLSTADDPEAMIAEMVRCTKPGGRVLIETWNPHAIDGISDWIKEPDTVRKTRAFTVEEIKSLLKRYGQAIVETSAFVVPIPGMLKIARRLEFLGQKLSLPFGRFTIGTVDRDQ